jgi:predicted DNA-binding ArsR family transcriptional regulator
MTRGRKPSGPKTLMEKVDKEYPNYSQEVLGLSVQQLEKRIADMQKGLVDAATFRDEKFGDEIRSLKEQLKDKNSSYTDIKKAVGLKTKYLVSLIREKGGA